MRHIAWISILVLVLTGCATGLGAATDGGLVDSLAPTRPPVPGGTDLPAPTAVPPTTGRTETTPPSGRVGPSDKPPAGAESQFTTNFANHSVPYDEILSGGPPKDGIPAIDTPTFVNVDEASEWLELQEPVVRVVVGQIAKAYPVQILMWHEIVNDVIGDTPVTVTFCPLCNTGIAFDRTLGDQVLDFGTTGRLRYSNLIMYDRQTETWWQQATGEGIAGQHTGRQLTFVPASMVSWSDFKEAHPDGAVLSRETGHNRNYGSNPYTGYDDIDRSPFLYDGPETPVILPPMARVLGLELNGEAVAYPYEVMRGARVVNDTVGGVPIAVLWAPGTASALDARSVAGGSDVGAAAAYAREVDGETLSFVVEGDRIVDQQTGTEWDVLGRGRASGQDGPLAGRQLEPVVSVNFFWFSWAAFKPDTQVYGNGSTSAAPPAVDSGV